jgi:hypothetical protein
VRLLSRRGGCGAGPVEATPVFRRDADKGGCHLLVPSLTTGDAPLCATPHAGGMLPTERRNRMKELLIDDDIATLKHHAGGDGENAPCPGRASAGLAPKFMAYDLVDPTTRRHRAPAGRTVAQRRTPRAIDWAAGRPAWGTLDRWKCSRVFFHRRACGPPWPAPSASARAARWHASGWIS